MHSVHVAAITKRQDVFKSIGPALTLENNVMWMECVSVITMSALPSITFVDSICECFT